MRSRFGLLFLLLSLTASAQFSYVIDQSIPVATADRILSQPWAGGLNAAQINTMDLNGDGKDDLVIFERTANKILTYVTENKKYVYHPEYEDLFPDGISQWMLLRDFNCDGRKDIFTSDPFGIAVFVNTTKPGADLSWRSFNPGFPLLTEGFSGNINLKINASDIPAIDDIDGDGDLDILNMRFVGIGTVEWHQNMSMELTGKCDSLQLKRITQTWGNVEECSCGNFAFNGDPCPPPGGRTEHAGGKTLLTIDIDNDGDRDLLYTEEKCTLTYLLENVGTATDAILTAPVPFPSPTPVNYVIFPGSYYEDVDFDNVPDFLSSPNLYARTVINNSFDHSVWFYKNNGTPTNPSFNFTQTNFLQDDMIDVGDYAIPAFVDFDGDGDQDMVISNYAGAGFVGKLSYYANTGSINAPAFTFVTDDLLDFSKLGSYNLKLQFVDINADGTTDLTLIATDLQNFRTNLYYALNKSKTSIDFSGQSVLPASVVLEPDENILLADIDRDGIVDLLRGRSDGSLQYWRNQGPAGTFNFVVENNAFMGLGPSILRSNVSSAIADLDADGRQDLIVGDQRGQLTLFGDFRGTQNSPQPVTDIYYNEHTQSLLAKNLGGRIHPTVVNLFNSDRPAIAVGTVMGGVLLLRNEGSTKLPEEPVVTLYPNPLPQGTKLNIKSDRNILMQVYSMLGQKMSEPVFITANETLAFAIEGLASGMYIAQFTYNGKHYGRRFVVLR